MLFVSDANILKYFRAIKSIDFYKHFISIDHLSFIFLHFLLWPQNIKEIPIPTQWLFLTSKNPLKLPTADKVPKSIYVILINIRYKQEKQKKKERVLEPCWWVWALFQGQRGAREDNFEQCSLCWRKFCLEVMKNWSSWS